MNCCLPALILALALSPGISGGQVLVDSNNYGDLFESDGRTVTVNPPNSILLGFGGTESGEFGNYWEGEANGGASVSLLGLGLTETGAQIALNGGELQFRITNNSDSLLDELGANLSLALDWSATATFDKAGHQLLLAPNTTYQLSFAVDGSNGLLHSTLGLFPQFGVELLDGGGNAVGAAGGGTLVNILGLELLEIVGSPPESGRAVVNFQTGSTVPTGAAGVHFKGSVLAPATLLDLGTKFAGVSDLQIAVVPEPSVLGLAGVGALALFRRRRVA